MTVTLCPPRWAVAALLAAIAVGSGISADPPAVADAIKAIKAVSKEGTGNEAAAAAWKSLTGSGAPALIPTLAAFDDASPTAANWLRSAIDAIAGAEKKAGRKLPADALETFLIDGKRNPDARRIAYELLLAQDKPRAETVLPTLIDDPSPDLRRDAIAARLEKAKTIAEAERLAAYRTLFAAARDKDQVEKLAELLEKAGEKQDLPRHFNYITEWHVVGPFDSTGGSGFAKVYPPELGVDLGAKYEAREPATWKYVQSDATYGTIDLNRDLGKHKDAAAYAYAVVIAEKETPVELRLASQNSIHMYVNGKKVFEREEYHHGTKMDQHVGRGVLKAGRNEILVKICQNNQTENWAQAWTFALRVCDATGGKVPLKQSITRDGKTETVIPGAIKPAVKKEDTK